MHQRIQEILSQKDTPHQLRLHSECRQPIKSPQDFAQALGYDISRVTKTLFLRSSDGDRFCLAVAPTHKRVDLNKIATALGVQRLQMGSREELKATLDYPPTGVSPLGCKDIPVFMDEALLQHPTVLVGGGVVGEEIEIAPAVLVDLCSAHTMSLAE